MAKRLGYRLFRNPLVMFGIGPTYAMVVQPRLVSRSARPRIRRSVIVTNIALVVLVGALCWLIGWRQYLLVQALTALLAGAVGVWLFYVQHQFEDTYWQSNQGWSYADAALRGSSYLKLPKMLQFFTGKHRPAPRASPQHAHPELPPAACARRECDLPQGADAEPVGWLARRPVQALGRGP